MAPSLDICIQDNAVMAVEAYPDADRWGGWQLTRRFNAAKKDLQQIGDHVGGTGDLDGDVDEDGGFASTIQRIKDLSRVFV